MVSGGASRRRGVLPAQSRSSNGGGDAMNKEDERMWWSLSKAKQRELERLARRFDFTVMEVLELARAFATAELNAKLDPAPGVGEPFEFTRPDFIMNDYFEHAAVPAPDARVNYIEA